MTRGLRRQVVPVAAALLIAVLVGVPGASAAPPTALGPRAVGPAADDDPVLVGAGDVAVCGRSTDTRTAELIDGIPGRVFAAGDLAYPKGSARQFRECYGPTWGRFLDRTSPAIGNHEYETRDARGYFGYFGARAGKSGNGWYAFDLGTWRVYVLNSNCDRVGCGPKSKQGQWLRLNLARHPRECVAAIWHHPLFSSGYHGNDPMVRPLWKTLADADADVVINGHDHDYERFAPQTAKGRPGATKIREFVVGTGGAALRPFPRRAANSVVRNASTHGVLELTLSAGAYAWRFVPVAGEAWTDTGSATCH